MIILSRVLNNNSIWTSLHINKIECAVESMLSFREKASKTTLIFKQITRHQNLFLNFIDYITINVSEFLEIKNDGKL